jgi:hypothetical protein
LHPVVESVGTDAVDDGLEPGEVLPRPPIPGETLGAAAAFLGTIHTQGCSGLGCSPGGHVIVGGGVGGVPFVTALPHLAITQVVEPFSIAIAIALRLPDTPDVW